jgi:hypothetical protein
MCVNTIKKLAACLIVSGLAACSSSSGSSGSGSSGETLTPITSKMPKTGTATYKGKSSGVSPDAGYSLTSDVRLDARFASNSIGASVTNIVEKNSGATVRYGGGFSGTGSVVGPTFTVPLAGSITSGGIEVPGTGQMKGVFRGSSAEEVEGSFYINGTDFDNDFTAIKQ